MTAIADSLAPPAPTPMEMPAAPDMSEPESIVPAQDLSEPPFMATAIPEPVSGPTPKPAPVPVAEPKSVLTTVPDRMPVSEPAPLPMPAPKPKPVPPPKPVSMFQSEPAPVKAPEPEPSPQETYNSTNNTEYNNQVLNQNNQNMVLPAEQNMAFNTASLGMGGPLSVGASYDSLVGATVNGLYAKRITDAMALSLLGEYGPDEYRISGTTGVQLYPEGRIKFTAEYLSQNLPFSFDSGDINQRVGQGAYGFDFQHRMNQKVVRDFSLGGYWAKAPNVALDTLNFIGDDGLEYENQRNLAGATSVGMDVGSRFKVAPSTLLDATLYYDSVKYNTEFTESSTYDSQGIGGGLSVSQLINDHAKVSVNAEAREIYDSYGVSLDYAPSFTKDLGMSFSVFAQHLISSNETPDSNTLGLQMNLLGDNSGKVEYKLDDQGILGDLVEWVKTPAVYMEQVMIIAEQITTLTAPRLGSITPNSGDLSGGNTVTIVGSNFAEGVQVLFGTLAGTVTLVSITELSVVVPAGLATGAVNVTIVNPSGRSTVLENEYTYIEEQPTIGQVIPVSGSLEGGDQVTIEGSNLGYVDTVLFGGIEAEIIEGTDEAIVVTTPNLNLSGMVTTASTTVDVSLVTISSNISTLSSAYTYQGVPVVDSVVPTSGSTLGRTEALISGSNFVGATSVSFGSSAVLLSSDDINEAGTQISVLTPSAGSTGDVNVTVTTPSGTNSTGPTYTYESPAAPVITSFTPTEGPTRGGSLVRLRGKFFSDTSAVTFGSAGAALSFSSRNDNTLVALTPPTDTAGPVNITVTASGGTTTTTDSFTYIFQPSILAVSPAEGPTTGGTEVIIGGEYLSNATAVNFGGTIVSPPYTANNDTSITLNSPAGSAGTVAIAVRTAGGTDTLQAGFIYVTAPTVTGLSPDQGSVNGGTSVVVSGTNLSNITAVYFGTQSATFEQSTDSGSSFTATAPASLNGASGDVDVTVVTGGGTSAISDADEFTYVALPIISSITPDQGSTITATTGVVITGSNLTGTSSVTFDGLIGTDIVVAEGGNSLTVTAPANATAGAVDVVVTTIGGSDTATDGFTYVAPPTMTLSPTSGSTDGTTLVTITGTDLSDATVAFGSILGTIITNDGSEITLKAPAQSSGAVTVTVTTVGGSATAPFTYYNVPGSMSLNTTSGPIAGGTTVVITGSNFVQDATSVTFGGTDVSSLSYSNCTSNICTSLTVTTPAHSADSVDVVATTSGGSSTLTGGYTYINLPTISGVSPNSGSVNGGPLVTISGSNFVVGATQVFFDTNTATTDVTVASNGNSLTVTAPAHTGTGAVTITVTTAGGSVTSGSIFTYYAVPVISAVNNPTTNTASGPSNTATSVTITGQNFVTGATTITFGTTTISAESVSVTSATSLTVTTPLLSAGSVNVSVTTAGGTDTLENGYEYVDAPTFESLSPGSGLTNGVTSVTIVGTHLEGAVVTFGSVEAASGTNNGSTIVTNAPEQSQTGDVPVTISTAGGEVSAGTFTYNPPVGAFTISPISGTVSGETTVTITGTGFISGDTTVTFDGVSGTEVAVISDTVLTVKTPAHATAGFVDVTVNIPDASNTESNAYEYIAIPVVSSVLPASGSVNGGPPVTITGTGFTGATAVTFGQVSAGTILTNNGTTLTVQAPANTTDTPGTPVAVSVTTVGGTGTLNSAFTYYNPPTLTAVAPSSGPTSSATLLTLTGTNFVTGQTKVFFGTTEITPVSVTDSETLTVTAPTASAGSVNVRVKTFGGTSNTLTYTYVAAPTISGVSPTSGSVDGTTSVTITGSNFVSGATQVYFGSDNTEATDVSVQSSTTLIATAPEHAAGAVSVTVTTAGGSASLSSAFTYYDVPGTISLEDTSGPTAGGETITIKGTNFVSGNTTVLFGTNAGTGVIVESTTSLTVVTPATTTGAVAVDVKITTPGGSSTSKASTGAGYTYVAAPTFSSMTPTSGATAGTTLVTITGTNLSEASVTFGGTPAETYGGTSSTQIEVYAPAQSAGSQTVTVETAGGSVSAGIFTYYDAPTITSLTTVGSQTNPGTTLGGTSVIIAGTNFVGDINVYFGDNLGTITSASTTSLTVVTPASSGGAEGTVVVTVEATGGMATSTSSTSFTYIGYPTITSLSPTSGTTSGDQPLTINGTYLSNAISFTIGGNGTENWAVINSKSANSITVTTPWSLSGAVTDAPVIVYTSSSAGTLTSAANPSGANLYDYTASAPTITSFSPTTVNIGGGGAMTIKGTNFAGATEVNFGSITASYDVVDPETITATIPASTTTGTVAISVTTSGGTATLSGFTYTAQPVITDLSSNFTYWNTDVKNITITGTNLNLTTGVTFAGTNGGYFTTTDPTSLATTALGNSDYSGNTYSGDAQVTTPSGSSDTGTDATEFTYYGIPTIESISPASGSTDGGDSVTITGTNLTGDSTVTFNGLTAAAEIPTDDDSNYGKLITVEVPNSESVTGTVAVAVTTPAGTGTSTYTYVGTPTITSLSSTTGTTAGGAVVTITGTNLGGTLSVTFGGVAGTGIVNSSSTQVQVTTPAGDAGTVDLVLTTPYGAVTATDAYTYAFVPMLTSISPNSGDKGTSVTINGQYFTGVSTSTGVKFGSTAATNIVVVSDTKITAKVPSICSAVTVSATNAAGKSTANVEFDAYC